jgi:hypothetical protein
VGGGLRLEEKKSKKSKYYNQLLKINIDRKINDL